MVHNLRTASPSAKRPAPLLQKTGTKFFLHKGNPFHKSLHSYLRQQSLYPTLTLCYKDIF